MAQVCRNTGLRPILQQGNPVPMLLSRQVRQASSIRRHLHVKATPSTTTINPPIDMTEQTRNIPKLSGAGPFPATVSFEVLGAPHSILSVALPASSTLYTRRGTLVGVTSSGALSDAVSTLSMLKPIRRAALGIPFLYQNVSSTSALNCLIATNTNNTTFAVVELDGAIDWMVTQKNALLAWTGHSLTTTPILNRKMVAALARLLGGKIGLVALVGKGQVYQLVLQDKEEMVVHPNNLLAYSITTNRPKPYRLAQTSLKFQIPKMNMIRGWFPRSRFLETMARTETYRFFAKAGYELKTWTRRLLWGDRLFLSFVGPATILIQSRGSRISDVLSKQEVNEMATAVPGALDALHPPEANELLPPPKYQIEDHVGVKVAKVEAGKVVFEDSTADTFIKK